MRIAIIGGSGHWGHVPLGSRGPGIDPVIAIAPGGPDEDVSKVIETCRAQGHPAEYHDDYRQMLDRCRPELVAVNPRYHRHAEIGIAVLERGIHCFLEKPVAIELADLARVEAAHARSGARLAPMLPMRLEPGFAGAWRSVQGGDIGEPRLISVQKSYRLGGRPDFFRQRSRMGGIIPWVGAHAIDLIRWFTGVPFVSVNARHSTVGNHGYGELEATALCQFVLADGVLATASLDYLRPAGASSHGDDRLRVAGTRGVIEVRDGRAWLLDQTRQGPVEITAHDERNIFAEFLAACDGRGDCSVSAADAFAVTRICLLARQSADEGREIAL